MSDEGHAVSSDVMRKALIDLAVESWRFARIFDRLLAKLEAGDQSRYQGQFRWFQGKLEDSIREAGMRLVNLEGHRFDPGIAATPLNIEEFDSNDTLLVEQMLEPTIIGPEGVLKIGTVTLRKSES